MSGGQQVPAGCCGSDAAAPLNVAPTVACWSATDSPRVTRHASAQSPEDAPAPARRLPLRRLHVAPACLLLRPPPPPAWHACSTRDTQHARDSWQAHHPQRLLGVSRQLSAPCDRACCSMWAQQPRAVMKRPASGARQAAPYPPSSLCAEAADGQAAVGGLWALQRRHFCRGETISGVGCGAWAGREESGGGRHD